MLDDEVLSILKGRSRHFDFDRVSAGPFAVHFEKQEQVEVRGRREPEDVYSMANECNRAEDATASSR